MGRKRMYLKMIINSLVRRKSRMFIAVLAIAIGATILSGLVTIYYDIPRQLGKEFRSYGANLALLPKGDEKINFTQMDEAREIMDDSGNAEVNIVGMAPYLYYTTRINEQPYMLAGTILSEAKKNSPFWFIDGEWAKDGSTDEAMIGREIARTLDLKPGDEFTIKGVKYKREIEASSQDKTGEENKERLTGDEFFDKKLKVTAIVTTGGAEEEFIFLDIMNLASIIDCDPIADIVECSIEADDSELSVLSGEIEDEVGILARPVRRVTQSQSVVLTKLKALVYLVTVIVLIITMISVSTTMMAMISERKKEIALKKALGAKNSYIISEILGEGAFLGLIGAIIGVILGFYFAQEISLNVFGRAISFRTGIIPLTLISSVVISIVASLIPVRRVLEIHPAIVLRGE